MYLKFMPRVIDVRDDFSLHSWANKIDELMASLMNNKIANLALVAVLFSEAPNKIFAMAAECRLFEESLHELVIFNFNNLFLLKSSFSLVGIF